MQFSLTWAIKATQPSQGDCLWVRYTPRPSLDDARSHRQVILGYQRSKLLSPCKACSLWSLLATALCMVFASFSGPFIVPCKARNDLICHILWCHQRCQPKNISQGSLISFSCVQNIFLSTGTCMRLYLVLMYLFFLFDKVNVEGRQACACMHAPSILGNGRLGACGWHLTPWKGRFSARISFPEGWLNLTNL
jgi:hypothetical protein